MTRFLQPLLLLLGRSDEHDLRRQVQYLKAENEILRARLPQQIVTTPEERARLLKLGKPLGTAIKNLISIVTAQTFRRWVRTEEGHKPTKAKPGRPRIDTDLRELIAKIAKETGFGYTRILGELRKLGIKKVCRQTVKNVLKEHGIDTGPGRSETTWDHFLRRHAKTLWAADFFSVRTWTMRGMVDCYAIVFMHVETRRVFVSPVTVQPDQRWVAQQARNFLLEVGDDAEEAVLIRDRDTKFAASFTSIMESSGVSVKTLPVRSPNLNANVERWIWSLQHEATNHFVFLGQRHVQHVVSEYVRYHNERRPHSARGHLPPAIIEQPEEVSSLGPKDVVRRESLGGLLVHYERRAA